MKPFANFSADFRRFIRRTPSARECAVIERLERQRKYRGRVRAVIDDPSGSLTPILLDYLRWHQQRLSFRDALIVAPQKFRPNLRAVTYTPRTLQYARGAARCVGQILLLNPDPRKLPSLLPIIAPLLSGKDSILIITGDQTLAARFANNPLFQLLPANLPRRTSPKNKITLPPSPLTFNLKLPSSPLTLNFSLLTFNLKTLPPPSNAFLH